MVANRCLCNENGIKSRAHGLIVSIVHDRSRYGTNLVIYCHYCIISILKKEGDEKFNPLPVISSLNRQIIEREKERE